MRSTGSSVPRSAVMARESRPACLTRRAVSFCDERATPAIRAPAAASATAMACPIPLLAPVTIAVLPVRSNGDGCISGRLALGVRRFGAELLELRNRVVRLRRVECRGDPLVESRDAEIHVARRRIV